MYVSLFQHIRSKLTCKDKQGFFCEELKNKFNYLSKIKHTENYWSLNPKFIKATMQVQAC
jgi:hypothetical protein